LTLYAQASKSNISCNIEDVLQVKKAFLSLSADKVGKMLKVKNNSEGNRKPKINMITRGPLRKEIIIPMAKTNAGLIINSAHIHISNVNKCLKNSKSDIIADFIHVTNNEIIITMNKLANMLNLSTIEKYLKNIENVNSDLIEGLCLSKSKLYIKSIRLSYKTNQGVITPNYIKSIFKELHLFKNVVLASKPHVIKVSPKSNMAVVWVNIWDSQSSSSAKNIINHQFNIEQFVMTVYSTNMNPGIPQCKNCWKWEYSTLNCHSHISRCAKCYKAHMTEHHKEKVWCCMENKKANQMATKDSEPSPHIFKCMNCKGDHQVDSSSCPYWCNCFSRD